MSLRTYTGLHYLFGLPLDELKIIFATVIEEMKKGGGKRGK
nr:MAG TPA: Decoration protein T5 Decoration Protein, Viral [Caudoviricetes sp.]